MDTSELESEIACLSGRLDDLEAEARGYESERDYYADQVDDLQRQLEDAAARASNAEDSLRNIAAEAQRLQLMTSAVPMRDRLDSIEALFTLASQVRA